jgi:hypothetical protein
MTTTLRTAAAFHQAGDAISALALGYSVWAVWVDDQHGECARALVLDAYDAAVILFASAIAQCRGAPSTSIGASNLARFNRIVDRDASHVTATGELVTSTGASTDSRTADRLWDACLADAERLVDRHWPAIERVAEALMAAGQLSGDDVGDLLVGSTTVAY